MHDPSGAASSAIELFADEISSGMDDESVRQRITDLLSRVAAELHARL